MPQIITDFCSLFLRIYLLQGLILQQRNQHLYTKRIFLYELSTIQSKWEHSQMLGFTSNFYKKKNWIFCFFVKRKIDFFGAQKPK